MRPLLSSFLIVLTGVLAPSAWAQTNDHFYRSWRWEEDIGSARVAGFSGAFVGLADDVSAVIWNPAGLSNLEPDRLEVTGNMLRRGAGTVGPGDTVLKDTGIGLLSAARRFGRSWAFGAHFGEPRDMRFEMAPYRLPDGSQDRGYVDASVRTFGIAGAYSPSSRLHLGAGVQASRLSLDGLDDTLFRRADTVQTTTYAEDTSLSASVGALYLLTNDLRVGAAYRKGAEWNADRFAFISAAGIVLDPGSSYEVRAPDIFSAGVSFRPMAQLLISGQLDHVFYSQIHGNMEVRQGAFDAAEYELDNGLEPRLGAEWSQGIKGAVLLVRGGIHSQAPGSLAYVGRDPVEQGTFVGTSRRLLGSAGFSLVAPRSIALDVGTVFGGDRTVFSVGGRMRF
jgi:long-subunit fatty acid transport protein